MISPLSSSPHPSLICDSTFSFSSQRRVKSAAFNQQLPLFFCRCTTLLSPSPLRSRTVGVTVECGSPQAGQTLREGKTRLKLPGNEGSVLTSLVVTEPFLAYFTVH